MAHLAHRNLDVRVRGVIHNQLPEAEFDLVHLRLVLAWLPEPQAVLERIVQALRPGGWLLAEELDFVSAVPSPGMDPQPQALMARIIAAHNALLSSEHTLNLFYGRRLEGALTDAGVVDLGCAGHVSIWRGASLEDSSGSSPSPSSPKG